METPDPITVERSGTLAVVRGEIDAHTAPQVRDTGEAILAEADTVRLDLRGVDFIDSSGLGVLVGLTSTARDGGGDVIIVAPSRSVVRLLQISGLDRHLTVHPG